MLFAFGIDGQLNVVESGILLVVFVIYLFFAVLETRKSTSESATSDASRLGWGVIVMQFLVSACAVGVGANVMVQNVEELSMVLKVDEGIVGVTVIAIGTNIPELVTTITSAKQNNPEIGIGNIFGASIINCTLLMSGSALSSASKTLSVSPVFLIFSILCLFLVTTVISLPILKRRQTSRGQGFLLLFIYFIYSLIIVKCL